MNKIEMFFDYHCPYCLKGYNQLKEFLNDKPDTEIVWHPCEIEIYKKSSGYGGSRRTNLSMQGMFFVSDNSLNIWKYHDMVYDFIFNTNKNIEDIDVFVSSFNDFLDTGAFKKAAAEGVYKNRIDEANTFAFKTTRCHVVPTFRVDGGCLQDRQEFFNMGPTSTGYGGRL